MDHRGAAKAHAMSSSPTWCRSGRHQRTDAGGLQQHAGGRGDHQRQCRWADDRRHPQCRHLPQPGFRHQLRECRNHQMPRPYGVFLYGSEWDFLGGPISDVTFDNLTIDKAGTAGSSISSGPSLDVKGDASPSPVPARLQGRSILGRRRLGGSADPGSRLWSSPSMAACLTRQTLAAAAADKPPETADPHRRPGDGRPAKAQCTAPEPPATRRWRRACPRQKWLRFASRSCCSSIIRTRLWRGSVMATLLAGHGKPPDADHANGRPLL